MSRGMTLGELMNDTRTLEQIRNSKPLILPPLPTRYAIKVGSYYFSENPGWTKNPAMAKTWPDKSAADDHIDHRCKHYMEVVDVTDQTVMVTDVWDHFN